MDSILYLEIDRLRELLLLSLAPNKIIFEGPDISIEKKFRDEFVEKYGSLLTIVNADADDDDKSLAVFNFSQSNNSDKNALTYLKKHIFRNQKIESKKLINKIKISLDISHLLTMSKISPSFISGYIVFEDFIYYPFFPSILISSIEDKCIFDAIWGIRALNTYFNMFFYGDMFIERDLSDYEITRYEDKNGDKYLFKKIDHQIKLYTKEFTIYSFSKIKNKAIRKVEKTVEEFSIILPRKQKEFSNCLGAINQYVIMKKIYKRFKSNRIEHTITILSQYFREKDFKYYPKIFFSENINEKDYEKIETFGMHKLLPFLGNIAKSPLLLKGMKGIAKNYFELNKLFGSFR